MNRVTSRVLGFRNNFRRILQRRLEFECRSLIKLSIDSSNHPQINPLTHNQTVYFSTSKALCTDQYHDLMEIKFEELKNSLSEKAVVLVDVRETKELLEDGKIPGSLNVPLGEVDSALSLSPDAFESKYGGRLPSQEDSNKLVVSCRSGKRAAMALDKVKKQGYENARIYSGSFLDWVANGGPTEKP